VATDISSEALALARQNAAMNGVAERIRFGLGDGLTALAPGDRFDLIVSNPPYIPSAEIAGLEPEVRDFDPRAALDGGADGLEFYRLLAAGAGARLRPQGRLMLEFGDGQEQAVAAVFLAEKWVVLAVEHDYSKKERFIVLHR
jgi:release factor glutamine methyltransferase